MKHAGVKTMASLSSQIKMHGFSFLVRFSPNPASVTMLLFVLAVSSTNQVP